MFTHTAELPFICHPAAGPTVHRLLIGRAFRFSAPSVWDLLPQTVLISDALSFFYRKTRLKTFSVESNFY